MFLSTITNYTPSKSMSINREECRQDVPLLSFLHMNLIIVKYNRIIMIHTERNINQLLEELSFFTIYGTIIKLVLRNELYVVISCRIIYLYKKHTIQLV